MCDHSADDEDVWERLRRLEREVRDLRRREEGFDPDEDENFLIGWENEHVDVRLADPWIAELWDEHPELVGYITPGGTDIYGAPFEPRWIWKAWGNVTIDADGLLAIVEGVARSHPDGFTYKDVARAMWGEDWTPDDASQLGGKLSGVLRNHARYEKLPQKCGPNVWRRRKGGRARKAAA